MSTPKKKSKHKNKLQIDTNPWQLFFVVIMFLIFFVVPVYVKSISDASPEQNEVSETYTSDALGDSQGNVAGATTDTNSISIPFINQELSTDMSNPANVLVFVGISFGLLSFALLSSLVIGSLKE